MLTGDKLETAENIGRSCNLITPIMQVNYLRSLSLQDT
jgi:magnesium-transporting ATPase (P-type)